MLQYVILNGKKIPVPVPVRTVGEVVDWVSCILLTQDMTITRFEVNGDDVDIEEGSSLLISLTRGSKVTIQADSAIELCIKSLDALRNLCSVSLSGMKQLAVDLWQVQGVAKASVFRNLNHLIDDLGLMGELSDHCAELLLHSQTQESQEVKQISLELETQKKTIELARSNSDWQACAKIMLNRIEPAVEDLADLSLRLQSELFELKTTPEYRLNGKAASSPEHKSRLTKT